MPTIAPDKGEPAHDVRVRSGQQQSGQPEGYAMLAMCTGGRGSCKRGACCSSPVGTPARKVSRCAGAKRKCTSHRQMKCNRHQKSRARSQRDPAALNSLRVLAADWRAGRNCGAPQLCTARLRAPKLQEPVLRNRKPQQQTAVNSLALAETANNSARRYHSGQTVEPWQSRSHRAHTSSHHRKVCLCT